MVHPALPDPLADAVALAHAALHDPDFRQAHAAARRIVEAGVDRVAGLQALTDGLRHEDPRVRRRAAQAFGLLGPAAIPAADALRRALRDPSWTVREAVVQAIALLPVECVAARTDLVACALHDRSPLVRNGAGRAAVQLGLAAPSALESALRHSHAKVRRRAVELLARSAPETPGLVSVLRNALQDGHVRVRLAAVVALGSFGPAAVVLLPRLVRCAFEADLRMRGATHASIDRLLREPAAAPLGWLAEALTLSTPEAALRVGLERPDLPAAVKEEFIAACGRRRQWHQKHGRAASASVAALRETPVSTFEAAQSLVAAVTQEARPGEYAWLLGLLCELWLKAP